ncbi:MAG: glycerol kinase GlpK [Clostridia bacterium]|nr:glycerol kinase GlpK [Clostridia bacterium]MBR6570505.1 glycerol kinase GlpK [Clostridia bacterium]
MKYLIALDQGTTSSRAIVFDENGRTMASHAIEFKQHYPQPGWVEHDPDDILNTQVESLRKAVEMSKVDVRDIAAIGITNQRETTLLWEKDTGRCVHNAIVWQCRRTAPYVEKLIANGCSDMIRKKTGLVPDAYFSGTKLAYLLDTLNLHERAKKGELCFGTVDTFLAWNLVEGRPHVTDATNAGRTMLFNLHEQKWDDELLEMLNIPREVLPEVVDTAHVIGNLRPEILGRPIPVAAMAGDQHASLFGQACFEPGMVKNTYGTGCFMLMNTGNLPVESHNGLVTTMAWRLNGEPTYALEGSVFMGGATVQWLRDEMHMIRTSAESEQIAESVPDTAGVYLVPAFTGLGAPYWDMYSRGTIVGMTRGTNRAHIVRAALEAICYQSADLFKAMVADRGGRMPKQLNVDGGASANSFMMQFQSDILDVPVVRPVVLETTALGAALLAGIGVGLYESKEQAASMVKPDLTFTPKMDEVNRGRALHGWKRAVERSRDWVEDK